MKLTTFTDYSLRVLMYLAAEPDRRATIADISTAFAVSENHLVKVVHALAKQGWVATVRGKGGGLMLAQAADQITVGRVIRDTEGAAMPAECFGANECHCAITHCCQLSGVLGEAVAAFYAVLDRYTLSDITKNKDVLSAVLYFHRLPKTAHAL